VEITRERSRKNRSRVTRGTCVLFKKGQKRRSSGTRSRSFTSGAKGRGLVLGRYRSQRKRRDAKEMNDRGMGEEEGPKRLCSSR